VIVRKGEKSVQFIMFHIIFLCEMEAMILHYTNLIIRKRMRDTL
jgi:hypothetical protein